MPENSEGQTGLSNGRHLMRTLPIVAPVGRPLRTTDCFSEPERQVGQPPVRLEWNGRIGSAQAIGDLSEIPQSRPVIPHPPDKILVAHLLHIPAHEVPFLPSRSWGNRDTGLSRSSAARQRYSLESAAGPGCAAEVVSPLPCRNGEPRSAVRGVSETSPRPTRD